MLVGWVLLVPLLVDVKGRLGCGDTNKLACR